MSTFRHLQWQSAPKISSLLELENTLIKNYPPDRQIWHDPTLMMGIKAATKRITQAIQKQERIMIFGDFDVDGITSTIILVHAIIQAGGQASYRIPDRIVDSHGLQAKFWPEIKKTDTKLIITCDCGINDHEAITQANQLGLDVIVTDHHDPDPQRYPHDAVAVINPKQASCAYPNKNLSGAGIAFKLICALYQQNPHWQTNFSPSSPSSWAKIDPRLYPYLELTALGLIADCMPLQEENFTLIKHGLKAMQNTQWPPLAKMLSNTPINAEAMSFVVAPRLNAASRLGKVTEAIQLFLGNAQHQDSRLQYLEQLNQQRKKLTAQITLAAQASLNLQNKIQILWSADWHPGLLGLIAGRLSSEYHQPMLIGTINASDANILMFSARSPTGTNIIQALRQAPVEFVRLGGHAGAAGCQIYKKDELALRSFLQKYYSDANAETPQEIVTAEIQCSHINTDILTMLDRFAPYGLQRPVPQFVLSDVTITEIKALGDSGQHWKIIIQKNTWQGEIVAWFQSQLNEKLKLQEQYDFLITISSQSFRGQTNCQCQMIDVRLK